MVFGTIDPQIIRPTSCMWDCPSLPQIQCSIVTYPEDYVRKMLIQYAQPEKGDICFWAVRSVFYFALQDNFISMTKIPFVLTESKILFVQRADFKFYTGFFAPFLPEAERQKRHCIEEADRSDEISTGEDAVKSIVEEEVAIRLPLAVLLVYFLQDDLAAMIGFTYKRASGQQTTRFWYKKVAIEPRS